MLKLTFLLIPIITLSYAYLDPGTGSYVLQVIVASILGAVFVFKSFLQKLITPFKKLFSKKKSSK